MELKSWALVANGLNNWGLLDLCNHFQRLLNYKSNNIFFFFGLQTKLTHWSDELFANTFLLPDHMAHPDGFKPPLPIIP